MFGEPGPMVIPLWLAAWVVYWVIVGFMELKRGEGKPLPPKSKEKAEYWGHGYQRTAAEKLFKD